MSKASDIFGLTEGTEDTDEPDTLPTNRASLTRRLLDDGWSPIDAHTAVTQGTVPERYRV